MLTEAGLEEGDGEGGGERGEARADGGAVGADLAAHELARLRQRQVGADRVKAVEDLVARHLDLVDDEVLAVLVHGQVVERRDQHGHEDLEYVLQRRARLQVRAAKVRVFSLEAIGSVRHLGTHIFIRLILVP